MINTTKKKQEALAYSFWFVISWAICLTSGYYLILAFLGFLETI